MRYQLCYVRSSLRHSPDQQEELLQATQDSTEIDAAEDGVAGGGEKWVDEDGMAKCV